MKKMLSVLFGSLLLTVVCSIANAQTVVRIGNDIGQGIPITFGHFQGIPDDAGGLFFDDLAVTTADGTTFTFDYTLSPGAGVGSLFSRAGFLAQLTDEGGGLPASAVSDFDDGDVINIAVSDVSNDYVFDGFANFGSAQTGGGGVEGYFIEGVADPFLRDVDNNGDTDPRFGIALPGGLLAVPSTTFTSVGTVTLRGVALQFSDGSFLLGDINIDGTVNFLDISPFIQLLTSGGAQAEGDINGDGAVSFLDIAGFITILTSAG